MAYDLIDAEQLAQLSVTTHRTTAERAYDDRTWTFGHVIVDEAQELGDGVADGDAPHPEPLDDRHRRHSPNLQSGGRTIVGGGVRSVCAEAVAPARALVNYRTPAEIMRFAARLLKRIDPTLTPPTSLRANGIEPMAVRARDGDAAVDAVALRRKPVGRG